jgi:hypothetical protein
MLTITAKFYTLTLLGSAVYSTYSMICIFARLRLRTDYPVMAARLVALRNLQTLLFLLFGLCSTNEAVAGLRSIRYSSMCLSARGIDAFEPLLFFAFLVFTMLTLLHCLQWAVSCRLRTACTTFEARSK